MHEKDAEKGWDWQCVFPARTPSIDPRSKEKHCHHIDQSIINKAIKLAVRKVGINKKINPTPLGIVSRRTCYRGVRIFDLFKLCLNIVIRKRR